MTYPALEDVEQELDRQQRLWGEQNHPDGTGTPADVGDANLWKEANKLAVKQKKLTWRLILLEEVYEALAESDPQALREELIQVAAVACQWALAIDRRSKE